MPENVTIREARPDDDSRIGELLVNSFVSTYGEKMPEVVVTDHRKADLRNVAEKRLRACVLVAEVSGRVVGSVTLLRPGDANSRAWTPATADLRAMAVEKDLHGSGISKWLLDRCVETARSWRAEAICLHVRRGAHGVARLYERHGYVRAPEGDADLLPEIFLEAYLLAVAFPGNSSDN
jgi:predicted N-acetyltransferase YhbS